MMPLSNEYRFEKPKALMMSLTWVFLAIIPIFSQADEMDERSAIKSKVINDFNSENFSALEATAEEFRKNKSRTKSGVWKLTTFYFSFNDAEMIDPSTNPKLWIKHEAKIKKWISLYPKSPTPHIAYAKILMRHGWLIRGSGYANEVEDSKWQDFNRYINSASDYLLKNKETAKRDPEWYDAMIEAGTALSWEKDKFKEMFDEAVAHEPYYYQTYFSAVRYLMPRWHGSNKDIDIFISDAVNATRKSEGTAMYARMYWFLSQMIGGDLFDSSRAEWPKMKAGFDDMIKQYPDSWNLNHYARFACEAADIKTAKAVLKRLNGEIIASAWPSEEFYNSCAH